MHDWDGQTLKYLEGFVKSHSKADVVAVTGDCFLSNKNPLPDSWNTWPHRLKLSVPGNHDGKKTFDRLIKWNHTAPYVCLHGWDEVKEEHYVVRHKWDRLESYVSHPYDITFIGLDGSKVPITGKEMKDQINELDASLTETGSALVILSHWWPQADEVPQVWEMMLKLCGRRRSLLILCGHEHHRLSERPRWSGPVYIQGKGVKCYCSHVFSQEDKGNLITWDGDCFVCK